MIGAVVGRKDSDRTEPESLTIDQTRGKVTMIKNSEEEQLRTPGGDRLRILVVESDCFLGSAVEDMRSLKQFYVSYESCPDSVVDRILKEQPDAVVLDSDLDGLDGTSICRSVRPEYSGVILILSTTGNESDEVLSLEFGADDYLTKPVFPSVLLARLECRLAATQDTRRRGLTHVIQAGSLTIRPSQLSAELEGRPLNLTTAEFEILLLLAESVGRQLSREELCRRLQGVRYDGKDRSIDLRISRLRSKLGDSAENPHWIKSIRGVGYILVGDSAADTPHRPIDAAIERVES